MPIMSHEPHTWRHERSRCVFQVANNKRYAAASGKGFTVSEVAEHVKEDFGKIDILVHSLANGPEVTKPLLETSRRVSLDLLLLAVACTRRFLTLECHFQTANTIVTAPWATTNKAFLCIFLLLCTLWQTVCCAQSLRCSSTLHCTM